MIEIEIFNDIENIKYKKVKKTQLILNKINEIIKLKYPIRNIDLIFSAISSENWLKLLNNRSFNVIISYEYAMFYYEKGINISPHIKYELENFYSFNYFVENYFVGGYTLFETIGHVLRISYVSNVPYLDEDKIDNKEKSNATKEKPCCIKKKSNSIKELREELNKGDLTFTKFIEKLQKIVKKYKKYYEAKVNHESNLIKGKKGCEKNLNEYKCRINNLNILHSHIDDINRILNSKKYKSVMRIRHDIVHNKSPLFPNYIDIDGEPKVTINNIKQYMDDFLDIYFEILVILKQMLEKDNILKQI